jgi:hypothetical protein
MTGKKCPDRGKALASICNHGSDLLLLGLHEVVYAGRPTGKPTDFKSPRTGRPSHLRIPGKQISDAGDSRDPNGPGRIIVSRGRASIRKAKPPIAWRPAGLSRLPTDHADPASTIEACDGGGQVRLHAGRPGLAA